MANGIDIDVGDSLLVGPQGEQGPQGPQGSQGESAYEVAVKHGYTGSEEEWLASLKVGIKDDDVSIDSTWSSKKIEASEKVLNGNFTKVENVSGMTDTTRVYVNSTDGNWYYYNGTAWQDGGVYQAAVYETDEMLKNSGVAADSKVTGAYVKGLNDGYMFVKSSGQLLKGYFPNGAYIDSNTRVSTRILTKKVKAIRVNTEGYIFRVYVYDLDNTYLGIIGENGQIVSSGAKLFEFFDDFDFETYKYQITFAKEDNSTITKDEIYDIAEFMIPKNICYEDEQLLIENSPCHLIKGEIDPYAEEITSQNFRKSERLNKNIKKIKAKEGYYFRLLAWALNGNFAGAVLPNGEFKPGSYACLSEFSAFDHSNYNYKLVIFNSNLTELSPTDDDGVCIYSELNEKLKINLEKYDNNRVTGEVNNFSGPINYEALYLDGTGLSDNQYVLRTAASGNVTRCSENLINHELINGGKIILDTSDKSNVNARVLVRLKDNKYFNDYGKSGNISVPYEVELPENAVDVRVNVITTALPNLYQVLNITVEEYGFNINEKKSDDLDVINIRGELSTKHDETHYIDMTLPYDDYISNVWDKMPYTKKHNIGLTADVPNKTRYNMYCYEFSPDGYEQTVLLTANVHGGEREAAYSLARTMQNIFNYSYKDEKILFMRNKVRFLVIPSVNPYGFEMDRTNYKKSGWSWRKYQNNARTTNCNRNWDFAWDNADINRSGTDYIGTDRMQDEIKNIWENVIKPNYDEISLAIDCHQGTYAYRYWCVGYPIHRGIDKKIKSVLTKLCSRYSNNKNYLYNTSLSSTMAAFINNIVCVPGYTAENSSLPDSGALFENYTGKSVNNFVEYIINLIYVHVSNLKNYRVGELKGEWYSNRLLPAPVSKIFGDMYNDNLSTIYNRFEQIPNIVKTELGQNINAYTVDRTGNKKGEIVVVCGVSPNSTTKTMQVTANPESTRTSNVTEQRTVHTAIKHTFAGLHLLEDWTKINNDDVIFNLQNEYALTVIPVANITAFNNFNNNQITNAEKNAVQDYIDDKSPKCVIYFDENTMADKKYKILYNGSFEKIITPVEDFITETSSEESNNLIFTADNVAEVQYTSSLRQGHDYTVGEVYVDYTTEQLTVYASAIVNVIRSLKG